MENYERRRREITLRVIKSYINLRKSELDKNVEDLLITDVIGEKVSVESDQQMFIATHATGAARPSPPMYLPCPELVSFVFCVPVCWLCFCQSWTGDPQLVCSSLLLLSGGSHNRRNLPSPWAFRKSHTLVTPLLRILGLINGWTLSEILQTLHPHPRPLVNPSRPLIYPTNWACTNLLRSWRFLGSPI